MGYGYTIVDYRHSIASKTCDIAMKSIHVI